MQRNLLSPPNLLPCSRRLACTHPHTTSCCAPQLHPTTSPNATSLLTPIQWLAAARHFGRLGDRDTHTHNKHAECVTQAVVVAAARTHRDIKGGGFVLDSLLHRAVWQGDLNGVIGQLCLFGIVAFLDLLEQLLTASRVLERMSDAPRSTPGRAIRTAAYECCSISQIILLAASGRRCDTARGLLSRQERHRSTRD
jgi:hypothetical protein